MNSYFAIWGGLVVLAGAIMVTFGNTNTSVFGSVLIVIGLVGPTLGGFLKRAYDEAPVDDKQKGTS